MPGFGWFRRYADFLEHQFNAGGHHHGALAWLLATLPAVLAAALGHALLYQLGAWAAWAWDAILLYLLMGIKEFAVSATRIAAALRRQDLDTARQLLGQWLGRDAGALSATEMARLAIEETLRAAYGHLFGVIFWFALLGPGGALLYRLARLLERQWGELEQQSSGYFGHFALRALDWLDWLPLRATAISFAIVGNFEDAMYCWRSRAARRGMDILLGSGGGALGVKLAGTESGQGEEADADYLDSAASLVWRALMLWLALLLLLTLAHWSV